MKTISAIVLGITMLCQPAFARNNTSKTQETEDISPSVPKSLAEKASYLMGYNMITELRAQGIEFDAKQMIEGMRAAIAGKDPPMTDEEIRNVMMAFERQIVQKQQSMMKQLAEKNSREGEAFLQANAEKPGVVRTESGLQYIVLEEGTGDTPAVTDKVRVRYVGSSIDGQVFDATDAGEAREFAVGAVVRGMTEALTKMKVGSKWRLFIPGELAFGAAGRGADIGPNQTIIFDLELMEIVK